MAVSVDLEGIDLFSPGREDLVDQALRKGEGPGGEMTEEQAECFVANWGGVR